MVCHGFTLTGPCPRDTVQASSCRQVPLPGGDFRVLACHNLRCRDIADCAWADVIERLKARMKRRMTAAAIFVSGEGASRTRQSERHTNYKSGFDAEQLVSALAMTTMLVICADQFQFCMFLEACRLMYQTTFIIVRYSKVRYSASSRQPP